MKVGTSSYEFARNLAILTSVHQCSATEYSQNTSKDAVTLQTKKTTARAEGWFPLPGAFQQQSVYTPRFCGTDPSAAQFTHTKALRTRISRFLGPKTVSCRAFGLF